MPVSSSKYREGPYDCDGVSTDFTFEYLIFAVEDLDVYLTDDSGDTLLDYGTHYDVFSADGKFTDGGTVRTIQTYPEGSKITIVRSLDILSAFNLTESGKLPSAALEAAVDRCILICQQLAGKTRQGIVLPILEESTMTLPATADRVGKFLFFGIDGSIEVKGLAELGAVTADESTIVLSNNILSVKDGGIDLTKLAQEVLDYITAEAAAIVDIHDLVADPHNGKFEAVGAAAAAIGDHEAAGDPHSQYNKSLTVWGMITGSTGAILNAGSGNWTVSRSAAGTYQLNITDAGDYMLSPTVINPSVNDHTSKVNGSMVSWDVDIDKFLNNSAGNVRVFDGVSDSWKDNDWSFIAIKL
jgi:hypothetical protein